jgi:hypothetical protein
VTETIVLILRALGVAVQMGQIFGGQNEKLAPILNTLAALAALPDATRPAQDALLALVRVWIAEKRGPTDAELDTFRDVRNELDLELAVVQTELRGLD